MLDNDYSQLPVLDGQNQILGMITNKNILRVLNYQQADLDQLLEKNAIESADKFDLENDIFDILPSLQANNTVLITGMVEEQFIGIITNYDTTEYFCKRSEDLMIIEEIELTIRALIQLTFENKDGIINNDNLQKSINRITAHINENILRSSEVNHLAFGGMGQYNAFIY